VQFVKLGEYLCEVWSRQYWKLEKLSSFEELLERSLPESRRQAYYMMAIHEKSDANTEATTWRDALDKARQLVKVARKGGPEFACALWVHKAQQLPREEFRRGSNDT